MVRAHASISEYLFLNKILEIYVQEVSNVGDYPWTLVKRLTSQTAHCLREVCLNTFQAILYFIESHVLRSIGVVFRHYSNCSNWK